MDEEAGAGNAQSMRRRLVPNVRALLRRGATRELVFYLGGEVGARLLTFSALIVIANVLAPDQFGLTSLYFSLSNLAAILIAVGLPMSVVRFYFEPIPFAAIIGSIVVLVAGSATVGLLVVVVFRAPLAAFLAVPEPLLGACLAGGVAIAFRSAWTASLRARRMSLAYGLTLVMEPIVGVAIVVVLFMVLGRVDYLTIAWSFVAATTLNALIAMGMWRRDPGITWDRAIASRLLLFSFPLIFHAFAMYALGTFDQVIINQTLGADEMGRYAYAYRWGMAMMALTAAYAGVWSPRFQELVRSATGRARLDNLARRGLSALGLAAVCLMIALPILARPFTPEPFVPALGLVPIVTYAYVWYALYTAVIGYAIYAKRTRRIASASVAVVIVTVVLNYGLIPVFGIVVAALTSVTAYMALFATQWWFVRDIAQDIRYGRLAVGALAIGVVPLIEWLVTSGTGPRT